MKTLVTNLERLLFLVAGLGLMASVGLAFWAVVLRYGFNQSLEWIEEAARYLALFSALLVTGPVLRHQGHVALDLIPSGLSGARLQIHRIVTAAIAFAVGLGVCLWGSELVQQTFRFGFKTGSLQFPQWLPYAIIPVGMALLMLFSLIEIIDALRVLRGSGAGRNQAPDKPG